MASPSPRASTKPCLDSLFLLLSVTSTSGKSIGWVGVCITSFFSLCSLETKRCPCTKRCLHTHTHFRCCLSPSHASTKKKTETDLETSSFLLSLFFVLSVPRRLCFRRLCCSLRVGAMRCDGRLRTTHPLALMLLLLYQSLLLLHASPLSLFYYYYLYQCVSCVSCVSRILCTTKENNSFSSSCLLLCSALLARELTYVLETCFFFSRAHPVSFPLFGAV